MVIFSYFKDLLSSAPRQSLPAQGEKGQGLVEYALILALIAVIVIGALTLMGTTVNNLFNIINATL